MKKNLVLPTIVTLLSTLHGQALEATQKKSCSSTREFITTFEYLRSDLGGDLALKYANGVAQGCDGSARRFIQTANSLRKTELPLDVALDTAKDLSLKNDENVQAFNFLFRKLYAQDGFDLDLKTSLDMARSLAIEFKGAPQTAQKDFEQLTAFCTKKSTLELPVRQCVDLAFRVAMLGGKHEHTCADQFIESYQYMTKSDSVGATASEALELSESLLSIHPLAFQNFKQAFEYAISSKGLGTDKKSALTFAKNMAKASVSESKAE